MKDNRATVTVANDANPNEMTTVSEYDAVFNCTITRNDSALAEWNWWIRKKAFRETWKPSFYFWLEIHLLQAHNQALPSASGERRRHRLVLGDCHESNFYHDVFLIHPDKLIRPFFCFHLPYRVSYRFHPVVCVAINRRAGTALYCSLFKSYKCYVVDDIGSIPCNGCK